MRLVLLALLLAGCGPDALDTGSIETPIVNGSVDTAHPAVGMLTSGGYGFCTATLVGTQTVLTAAHCVVNEKAPPFSMTQQLGWSPDGVTTIPAASVAYHPSYTGTGTNNFDVAVLRLSQPVTNITPKPVATSGPQQGEPLVLVGFGYTSDTNPDSFGIRRKADNTVGMVTNTEIVMYGAAGSEGNICFGDSGGPAFATRNGHEVLVGIHSWGEGQCGVAEHDVRSDVYLGWIAQQAQGNLYQSNPTAPSPPPPPADTQPPQVAFVAPTAQSVVGPTLQVHVSASDDTEVARVELFVDGKLHGDRPVQPYDFQVTDLAPGSHNLRAEALDTAGRRGSTLISVTVQAQTPPSQPPPAPSPPPATGSSDPSQPPSEGQYVGGCSLAGGPGQSTPGIAVILLLALGLRARRRD